MSWNCNGGQQQPVVGTVTDCVPIIRFLLNDLNPSAYTFQQAVIQQGVSATLSLNELPGFSLMPDGNTITPAFPGPEGFALLNWKTARLFILGRPDKSEYRTRALTIKEGTYRDMMMKLDRKIFQIENGAMFGGWQMFYSFLSGISNLSLLEVFTQMNVSSPFYSVTLTATGGTAAS